MTKHIYLGDKDLISPPHTEEELTQRQVDAGKAYKEQCRKSRLTAKNTLNKRDWRDDNPLKN